MSMLNQVFPHACFALGLWARCLSSAAQSSTTVCFISWLPFGLQGQSQLEAVRLELSRRGGDGTDQRDQLTEKQEDGAALEWKLSSFC